MLNGKRNLRTITLEIGILLIIRDHPLIQVRLTGDENNYSSSWIEFGDVSGWETDSAVDYYLVNRILASEYGDADRTDDCDPVKT